MSLKDQVDVYLGGRLLRKDYVFLHDTTVTLDNISTSTIKGNIVEFTTSTLQSLNANPGESYIDSNTGKVWTYTITRTDDIRYPGWVYSGLTQLAPEFSMTVTQSLQTFYFDNLELEAVEPVQTIRLNSTVDDNLELAIVAKTSGSEDFNTVISPGTTVPLWSSTTSNAINDRLAAVSAKRLISVNDRNNTKEVSLVLPENKASVSVGTQTDNTVAVVTPKKTVTAIDQGTQTENKLSKQDVAKLSFQAFYFVLESKYKEAQEKYDTILNFIRN
jgi:hypothetical protein